MTSRSRRAGLCGWIHRPTRDRDGSLARFLDLHSPVEARTCSVIFESVVTSEIDTDQIGGVLLVKVVLIAPRTEETCSSKVRTFSHALHAYIV